MNWQELKTNPKNPRKITAHDLEKLKKSLAGFTKMLEIRPIAYDEDGIVWGGNQRLKQLRELVEEGTITEVKDEWFKELRGFTEAEKHEFAIKDNREFGIDDIDILMGDDWSIYPLDDWGIDLSAFKKEVHEDDAPEVSQEPPVSKLGEVYQLGRHRLMCGDSTKIEDVEKLMNGNKADMVFTDPPYGVNYKSQRFDAIENDDVLLTEWIAPALAHSSGWVLFCTSWKVVDKWMEIGSEIGKLTNMIIWDKGGGGIGDLKATLSTDFEIILAYNRKNEIKGKRIGTVWSINKDGGLSYEHPTQKPVALPAQAINILSTGSVLDLFGGSGSTLIACEQLDRTCYMMELDPKYCDVIRKRYRKFVSDSEEGWEDGTR